MQDDLMGPAIDNLSPPIPYPSNIERMDQSSESYSHEHPKVEQPQPVIRKRKDQKSAKTT
jgi:hypothetical protein